MVVPDLSWGGPERDSKCRLGVPPAQDPPPPGPHHTAATSRGREDGPGPWAVPWRPPGTPLGPAFPELCTALHSPGSQVGTEWSWFVDFTSP